MIQVANPGTVITLKVDEAWKCHCGAEQPRPGVWVAAHWSERLTHRMHIMRNRAHAGERSVDHS